jgi:hypothetical protein
MQAAEIFERAGGGEGESVFIFRVEGGGVELALGLDDRVRNVVVVLPHDPGPDRDGDDVRLEHEVVDGDAAFGRRRGNGVDGAAHRHARRECAEALFQQGHWNDLVGLAVSGAPPGGDRRGTSSRRCGRRSQKP